MLSTSFKITLKHSMMSKKFSLNFDLSGNLGTREVTGKEWIGNLNSNYPQLSV